MGCYALALAAAGASNLIALCVLAAHAVAVLAACWPRTREQRRCDGPSAVRAHGRGWPSATLAGFSLAAIVGGSP